MRTILIGLDDTDNLSSPGTGSLARDLCAECVKRGMKSLGITRHQFLFDRAIPYTSHNSGACIALKCDKSLEELWFAFDFVADLSAEGSDPGVCVAYIDEVPQEVFEFGRAAQREILPIDQAFKVAKNTGIKLHGLGGDCLGVIGAVSSVALRAQGDDGRFIDMPGLRDLSRRINISEYEKIGIEVKHKIDGRQPCSADVYDTLNWARPSLIDGKSVLTVEWSETDNVWIPTDRKKNKS